MTLPSLAMCHGMMVLFRPGTLNDLSNGLLKCLATWAPDAREAYDQMAEGIVEHGYGASLRNAADSSA